MADNLAVKFGINYMKNECSLKILFTGQYFPGMVLLAREIGGGLVNRICVTLKVIFDIRKSRRQSLTFRPLVTTDSNNYRIFSGDRDFCIGNDTPC